MAFIYVCSLLYLYLFVCEFTYAFICVYVWVLVCVRVRVNDRVTFMQLDIGENGDNNYND